MFLKVKFTQLSYPQQRYSLHSLSASTCSKSTMKISEYNVKSAQS